MANTTVEQMLLLMLFNKWLRWLEEGHTAETIQDLRDSIVALEDK